MSQDEQRARERERKAAYRARKKAEAEEAATRSGDEPLREGVGESGPSQLTAAPGLGEHAPGVSPTGGPGTTGQFPRVRSAPDDRPPRPDEPGEDEQADDDDQGTLAHELDDDEIVRIARMLGEAGGNAVDLRRRGFDESVVLRVAAALGSLLGLDEAKRRGQVGEARDDRVLRAIRYQHFLLQRELEPLLPRVEHLPVHHGPDPKVAAKAAKRSSWDG